MLASLFIKPAQGQLHSSNKDTRLKYCVVETPIVNSIIFQFEPNDKYQGNWPKKLMFDKIKNRSAWVEELNLDCMRSTV